MLPIPSDIGSYLSQILLRFWFLTLSRTLHGSADCNDCVGGGAVLPLLPSDASVVSMVTVTTGWGRAVEADGA